MRAYLREKYYIHFDLLEEYYSDQNGNNDSIHGWYSNLGSHSGLSRSSEGSTYPNAIVPDAVFSNLPELLYHWPDKECVLKEVMPIFPLSPNPFPQRLNDFITFI